MVTSASLAPLTGAPFDLGPVAVFASGSPGAAAAAARRGLVQAVLGQRGVELPARRARGELRVGLLDLLVDDRLERLERLRAAEVAGR